MAGRGRKWFERRNKSDWRDSNFEGLHFGWLRKCGGHWQDEERGACRIYFLLVAAGH